MPFVAGNGGVRSHGQARGGGSGRLAASSAVPTLLRDTGWFEELPKNHSIVGNVTRKGLGGSKGTPSSI